MRGRSLSFIVVVVQSPSRVQLLAIPLDCDTRPPCPSSPWACNTVLYSIGFYFRQQIYPQIGCHFRWSSQFILFGANSNCPPLFPHEHVGHLLGLGGLLFGAYLLPFFIQFVRFSTARISEWSIIPSASESCFVKILHCSTCQSWCGPTQHGS